MMYPLELTPKQQIRFENKPYKIHRVDFWENERFGSLHNTALIETATGCQLAVSIARQVETE